MNEILSEIFLNNIFVKLIKIMNHKFKIIITINLYTYIFNLPTEYNRTIHGVYLINLSYVTQRNELYLKMIDLLKNTKGSHVTSMRHHATLSTKQL